MESNKRLLMMAALLASSSAVEIDDVSSGELNIRAVFDKPSSSELVTNDAYRIEIEKVKIGSGELDVRPRQEGDLDEILTHLQHPTVDVTPGTAYGPTETELVLTNARFQGRVFDDSGSRLPDEGLGISGDIPLNVRVVRTGDKERPVDVKFEVPTRFFDGIDWSYAGIT